jgi:hypothetical protein
LLLYPKCSKKVEELKIAQKNFFCFFLTRGDIFWGVMLLMDGRKASFCCWFCKRRKEGQSCDVKGEMTWMWMEKKLRLKFFLSKF